jgi:hypothetical protein
MSALRGYIDEVIRSSLIGLIIVCFLVNDVTFGVWKEMLVNELRQAICMPFFSSFLFYFLFSFFYFSFLFFSLFGSGPVVPENSLQQEIF